MNSIVFSRPRATGSIDIPAVVARQGVARQSSMRTHTPFRAFVEHLKQAPALSRQRAGALTAWSFDLDADGRVDARLVEGRSGDATYREFVELDAEGWPVKTFLRRQPSLSALVLG
jgi:hypothetical protein